IAREVGLRSAARRGRHAALSRLIERGARELAHGGPLAAANTHAQPAVRQLGLHLLERIGIAGCGLEAQTIRRPHARISDVGKPIHPLKVRSEYSVVGVGEPGRAGVVETGVAGRYAGFLDERAGIVLSVVGHRLLSVVPGNADERKSGTGRARSGP